MDLKTESAATEKESKAETYIFTDRQRKMLADKFADLANIAIGSLIFGYVINSEVFNQISLLLGFLIAIAAYIFAVRLEK
jgi:hypothetical protein